MEMLIIMMAQEYKWMARVCMETTEEDDKGLLLENTTWPMSLCTQKFHLRALLTRLIACMHANLMMVEMMLPESIASLSQKVTSSHSLSGKASPELKILIAKL